MKGVVGASMDQRDREQSRSAAPSNAAPQVADSAEAVLQLAIDLYGPALLSQPDKLRRQLDEQCPAATFDSSLLLSALAEGVPQALMGVSSGNELRRLVPQLEQALIERRGLNPFGATWAVTTWATVLRMDSEGLATSLESMAPAPPDAYRDEHGPVGMQTIVNVEQPIASSPSTDVVPPFVEPVTSAPSGTGPIVSATEQEPLPTLVPAPATTLVFVAPPPAVEPQSVVEDAPVVEAAIVVEPVTVAAAQPVFEPTPGVQPLPMVEPAIVVAHAAQVDPVAVVADAEAWTASLPAWSRDAGAGAAAKRFNPWFGVAGVVVAIVVAIVALRWVATRNTDEAQSPVVAAPPVSESKPVPAAEPARTSTDAVAVAPTTTGIVDVTSDEPLAGDGRQHDVFVAIDPQRTDVRWVVVQFIGGDGAWESRPRVVDVTPEALRNGRVPVGTIGLRTTRPASATFQYALTAADGHQTAPFVKQFTFTPVAGRPPVFVDVMAPAGLVVGEPFAVTIDYRVGDAKLVSVERKRIDPPADTEGGATVTAVDGLVGPTPGRLRYPFDAVDSPSRSTVVLTLIDEDGLRSEPRRVVLDIVAPAAPAVPARLAAPAAAATAAVPIRATPVAPAACTRETCGSVVSVREADVTGRTKNYEVIVRLDDRSIRPLVVPGTWKIGRRVRVIGDRVVAVDDTVRPAPPKPRVAAPGRLLPESVPIIDQ